MRRTTAGESPEKERWLLSELKSGMDDWDPGPARFERVLAVKRKRAIALRRNSLVGVLAAVACVLLLLTFAPPGAAFQSVAGNFVTGLVGVQTPPPAVGPGRGGEPTPQVTGNPNRGVPPVISSSPGQQREPLPVPAAPVPSAGQTPGAGPTPASQPQQTPAPGPSEAPVVAGPQSPAAAPSPSPSPFCLLHLLCL